MQTITTNLSALFGQRELSAAQGALSQSVERLSSGLRINRAKDDAAGLGISQELQRQTRAFAVASRNANDAVSMVQTAEGSLQSVSDMLIRMKELTTQGANESLSKEQRSFIAAELVQLRKEINAVAERTTFNNTKLLTGDFSEAVKGEFIKAAKLDGTNNSVLATSTLKISTESETNADPTKSLFTVADVQVDTAKDGKYTISADGATITLSRTDGLITKSSSLKLVSNNPGANEVAINNTTDGTMELNFSDFGVVLTVKNKRIGTSDRSASEIATKIAALGATENDAFKNKGWKAVSGADWAVAPTGDPTAELKAIITSTAGNIRITNNTGADGIRSVQGYPSGQADGVANLGSWTAGAVTEIAFRGTAAELNTVLKTLEVNNTTGLGEVTVNIVPNRISVYTNAQGVTSYYEVINTGGPYSWTEARAAATAKTFNGLSGYLTNITSTGEQTFIAGKLTSDGWIGASDSDLLGIAGAAEGTWRWVDGPEKGLIFWVAGTGNVSGGANQVSTAFSNWNAGEPNDSDAGRVPAGEDYAYAISGNRWNDYNNLNRNTAYVVEYGGEAGVSANTAKTILIGSPGYINVGDAVDIQAVATSGVGANSADTGIYRLSANTAAKTVTLKRFDVDGETLLASQTLSKPDGLEKGRYTTLAFTQLGVSLTLSNSSDRAITLGDLESGLEKDLAVASSRMASLIGAGGPKFQTGVGSRNDLAVAAFRDMRMGKNTDSEHGSLFNEVHELVSALAQTTDPSTATFQRLENKVEGMIEVVAAQRSDFGAIQNRLDAAINNITEQHTNLTAAKSQIEDTDFAWETARLTRLQIGQQAATAMLAQANAIPNVIMALIE
jgi:flagellin